MAELCRSHIFSLTVVTLIGFAALVHSSALRDQRDLAHRQERQLGGIDENSTNVDELGTVKFPETGARKRDPISQPALGKMAVSSVRFTWDSYRALQISPTENVFFSPYSIVNALGMLTLGSDGTTKAQLMNLLYVDPSLTSKGIHEGLRLENLKLQNEESAVFAVANRFFVDTKTTPNINPEYIKALATYYNSSMEPVSFLNDPAGARNIVNNWVDQNTYGKIKEFLPANLDPNTQLILANAIYFNGKWELPFNPQMTVAGNFRPSEGSKVTVPFMHLNTELYYAHDEFLGLQTVIIPYNESKYAMHVIMPDESLTLAALEDTLSHLHLDKIDRSTRLTKVVLKMPKFNLRQRISLRDMLFRLNATDVFNPLKNDFSGLFLNDRHGFFVDEVIHEAVVEVNEEGTVAAAATGIIGTRVANPAKLVFLNRPFLFYISDESNGFILFWGRVENPTK